MRGHWVSTTRKFARHYQSITGSSDGDHGGPHPPFPPRPTYGLFSCICYSAPFQFKHVNGTEANLDYYDVGFSYIPDTTSSYIDNMVRVINYRGFKYEGQYDGCFQTGGRLSGIPEIDNNNLYFGGKYSAGYAPITSTDLGDMRNTGPEALSTGLLYKDYGYKYVKVHHPKYAFGPGYYANADEIDVSTLPSGTIYTNENILKARSAQPIYNGIKLNAYDSYRLASISGSGAQRIVLTQEYTDYYGNHQTLNFGIFSQASGYFSIYNNMEPYGLTTIEGNVSLITDRTSTSRSIHWTLHAFFLDGEFYFTTHPELTYNGVDVTDQYNVYISKYYFPGRLGGYPVRGPFTNLECPDFKYWLEYDFGDTSTDLISRYFYTSCRDSYKAPYQTDYELYYPRNVVPYLRVETLTEAQFNAKEAEWHLQHS